MIGKKSNIYKKSEILTPLISNDIEKFKLFLHHLSGDIHD